MPAAFPSLVVTTKVSPDSSTVPWQMSAENEIITLIYMSGVRKDPCVPQLGVLFCQFLLGTSIGRKSGECILGSMNSTGYLGNDFFHYLLTHFLFSVQGKNILEPFSNFKITFFSSESWFSVLFLFFFFFHLAVWDLSSLTRD